MTTKTCLIIGATKTSCTIDYKEIEKEGYVVYFMDKNIGDVKDEYHIQANFNLSADCVRLVKKWKEYFNMIIYDISVRKFVSSVLSTDYCSLRMLKKGGEFIYETTISEVNLVLFMDDLSFTPLHTNRGSIIFTISSNGTHISYCNLNQLAGIVDDDTLNDVKKELMTKYIESLTYKKEFSKYEVINDKQYPYSKNNCNYIIFTK